MVDTPQIHVHPDLLKAVEVAVEKAVGGLNLLDLQKCREDLQEAVQQFRSAAQSADTWQKIAKLQGEKIDRLEATVAQLQAQDAERHAEIVRLMAELSRVSQKP